jgi:integration host factor subunit alpha
MNPMNATDLEVVLSEQHRAMMRDTEPLATMPGGTLRLTKAELADLLFTRVGLNKREAKEMVDAFFTVMRDALESGENVKLAGFGNFQLRDKRARPGRNPKTGETVLIASRRVVTFYASRNLKARLKGYLPAVG